MKNRHMSYIVKLEARFTRSLQSSDVENAALTDASGSVLLRLDNGSPYNTATSYSLFYYPPRSRAGIVVCDGFSR